MSKVKKSIFLIMYSRLIAFMKAYMPKTRAKIAYLIAYKRRCNLDSPKTFSEKLLWLSLNTYRKNELIFKLSDKYLVREYIIQNGYEAILNELYYVWDNPEKIDFESLPNKFVLKKSQGCQANIICKDKLKLDKNKTSLIIKKWDKGEFLYDKMMADIGGLKRNQLKNYYICEKYLEQPGEKGLIDYKIYCFNGIAKTILVIADRFGDKKGAFMTTDWEFLSELSGNYNKINKIFERPKALDRMVEIAEKLSKPFPFVRVDLYEIMGKIVFGELTFFPNGCIKMQETNIDGKDMGELLDISKVIEEKNRRINENVSDKTL